MANRDALSQLPGFKWRGKEYPIESSRHSFRHETAEHRVSYGGLTLVEPLGPQNPTFQYTIPMDQGIAAGPYSDLLLKVPVLARDMYDRTPGELTDPLYGTWTVIPSDYSSDLQATKRSGIVAMVSFVWAPDLDQDVKRKGGVDSITTLANDAAALDAEVERVARKFDKAANPPRINPLDLVSSVTGQISRNIDKTKAKLQNFTYQVEKTERYILKLVKQTRDPDAFGAHREARRIRSSAVRTQRELNALVRDIGQITVSQAKNVLTVAAEANMTVKDLLVLNTQLAAAPVVPAGTVVNVYRARAA